MTQTVEQIVRKFKTDSKTLLRENKSPAKARSFLLQAGILEKHRKSPGGVRLAKKFR